MDCRGAAARARPWVSAVARRKEDWRRSSTGATAVSRVRARGRRKATYDENRSVGDGRRRTKFFFYPFTCFLE